MNRDKFDILIQKYQNGELKGSEKTLMDQWFESLDAGDGYSWTKSEREILKGKIMARIKHQDARVLPLRIFRRRWIPYAAAIFLIATSGSLYFFYGNSNVNRIPATANLHAPVDRNDIPPGGNRATLTLADGRVVELSESHAGIVIGDGEIKYDNGVDVLDIRRHGGTQESSLSTKFYVLSTPKGGQYQIVLPDGSKVWLNSASTLRYPTKFADSTREVELEGEAYFQVDGRQHVSGRPVPFLVKTSNQVVEVFGTQFNISAYADDAETRTTLVSGEVRVSMVNAQQTSLLRPGQESVIDPSGIQIRKANVESAIAWKSGVFHFDEIPFRQMMKQISRWYDIEVVYEGAAPEEVFSGKMSRSVSLRVLLDFLKDSGINLRLKGNLLIVNR